MSQEKPVRVAIFGLGLIGGSLGLALKAAGAANVEVIGCDIDGTVLRKARQRGAIDKGEAHPIRAVREANLVVLATPISVLREVMAEIAPGLPEGCVVTDTASTKEGPMLWARDTLPPAVSFIGGHPMAGKEEAGIEAADAGLFQDKAYCVCPPADAPEAAINTVLWLAQTIGARPLFVEAKEHDQYAAAISHLPMVISYALFSLVRASPAWQDIAPLAASGFRDMTRLASGDPQMAFDICLSNREAVLHWLERLSAEIDRYRSLISAGEKPLFETFIRAQLDREVFLAMPPGTRPQSAPGQRVEDVPNLQESVVSFFAGRGSVERWRRLASLGSRSKPQQEGREKDGDQRDPGPHSGRR